MSGSLLRRPQRRPTPVTNETSARKTCLSNVSFPYYSALRSTGAAAWPPCSQGPGHGSALTAGDISGGIGGRRHIHMWGS